VQSVFDHPVEKLWEVVMFDDERRTDPLKIILDVVGNPFTGPFSKRPNERECSLRQNPEVGFAGRAVHCLPTATANGGSGLIGNKGRKTVNVCDKHAKETTRNSVTHFTAIRFHHSSPETAEQSS
jgi:hypothetical protein